MTTIREIMSEPPPGRAMLPSVIDAGLQGASYGFSDELEALLTGTPVEEIRQRIQHGRESWPKATTGTELAGGFVGPGGIAGGLAKIGRSAWPVVRGGAEGLMSYLGYKDTENITDIDLGDAAVSTVLGAGLEKGADVGLTALSNRVGGAKQRAAHIVENAMGQGESPAVIAQMARDLGPAGLPADATQGLRSQLAGAANIPGPGAEAAKETLRARQMGQPLRISEVVAREANLPPGSRPKDVFAAKQAERRAAGNAMYPQLHGMQIQPTAEMMQMTTLGHGPAAAKVALRRIQDEGLPYTLESPELYQTPRFWDYMSRELDRMAKPIHGGAPASNLKRRIDSAVDAQTGNELSRVRSEYARLSGDLDSFEAGEKFLKMPADDAIDSLAGMTTEERRMHLAGVTRAIQHRLQSGPETGNSAWNMIKSTGLKMKLEALLGTAGAARYIKRMEGEIEQTLTHNQTLTGARTAPLLAAMEVAPMGEAAAAGGRVLSGDVVGGGKDLLSALFKHNPKMDAKTANEVVNILLSNPDEFAGMLQRGNMAAAVAPAITHGVKSVAGTEAGRQITNARN